MVTTKQIDQTIAQAADLAAQIQAVNLELKKLPMGPERAKYQRLLDEITQHVGLEPQRSVSEQRGVDSWLARAAECRDAAGLYRKAGDLRRSQECEREAEDAERKAAYICKINE